MITARLAARAAVPVFVARGIGTADVDARLRASSRVTVLDSPRAATVLVVAGHVPSALAEPLARVHDQLAHPRATVWWTGDPGRALPAPWSQASVAGPGDDIEDAVVAAHRAVITGGRPSEPAILPDVDPVPWRGVGPYGHGGTGMTGGTPYGRPMAERADDRRDGLALDVVPIRVGPFFPPLPARLVLEVTLAGDVVHDLVVVAPEPADPGGVGAPLPDDALAPFDDAAARAVPVAELERARARQHLRWLARLVHLHGLDALARRVARLSVGPLDDPTVLSALARRLDRPWVLGRTTRGVGVLAGDAAAAWGGPVARAAGLAGDARAGSAAYAALGFEPVVHDHGDSRDRWRQRLAEAEQAVGLAARAGSATVAPGEPIEPPVPPPPGDAAARLTALVAGCEWGDALATIVSVDPDLVAAPVAAAP